MVFASEVLENSVYFFSMKHQTRETGNLSAGANGANVVPHKGERLLSLDVLRGFDMFFIMGGDALMAALAAAFGAANGAFARQFQHVPWAGLAFEDTIFPLFLFIAGVSFPFSLAKRLANGASKSAILLHTLRRGFTLILLGLVTYGLLNLDFAHQRVFGVLQQIGFAWMVAAILRLYLGWRARTVIALALLIGTSLLFGLVGAPDFPNAAHFTAEGNLGCWFDRTVVGVNHLFLQNKLYDPEGSAGFLTSIVTAMLGMFAGDFLRSPRSGSRKALGLLVAAAVLVVAGLLASLYVPVVKRLWTSSFVLVAGGYSAAMLALFYYVIDVRKIRFGTTFFRVIGMNAITIYMAQQIIDFDRASRFFVGGVASLLPGAWEAVGLRLGYVAVCWLFLYFLYKKNVFLKV